MNRPMWCAIHERLEFGPGGEVPPEDHTPYEDGRVEP